MRKIGKILLAWLCITALLSSCALAEFSPRLEELKKKDAMALEVSGQYNSLAKVSKASLKTINQWLENVSATVKGTLGGAVTSLSVMNGDDEALAIMVRPQEDDIVTIFLPSGNAYLTRADQPTAFSYLTGEEPHLLDVMEFPNLYDKLAKSLYPLLESKVTGKEKKARTTIRNATASPRYVDYVLREDEMNAAWPEITATLLPILREALADQPARYKAIAETLTSVTFSGSCRFKRFLDRDRGDMGLQFTGNANVQDEVRKITLYGGYTPEKGGYLSFAAPQVKGKNTLKFTLSCTLNQKRKSSRSLKIESTYTHTAQGETEAFTINATLRNAIKKDGDEKWSGKVTVTETKKRVKTTYTFTPALSFTEEGLSGKVTVQRKTGSKTDMKATLKVALSESPVFSEAPEENAKDLRKASEKKAKTAVQAELTDLTRAVVRLFSSLPEDQRTLLTHELRTDEWMTELPEQTKEPAEDEEPAEEEEEKPAGEAEEEPAEETEEPEEEPADETEEEPADEAEDGEEPAEDASDEAEEDAEDEGGEDAEEPAGEDEEWPEVTEEEADGEDETPQDEHTDDELSDEDWFSDDSEEEDEEEGEKDV